MNLRHLFPLLPLLLVLPTAELLSQNSTVIYAGPGGPGQGGSIAAGMDGGYAVVGQEHGYAEELKCIRLVKFNAFDEIAWVRSYSEKEHPADLRVETASLAAFHDGGFLLACAERPTDEHPARPVLIRVNASGERLWSSALELGDGWCEPTDLAALPDGDMVLVGRELLDGLYVGWIARLNPNGKPRWIRRLQLPSGRHFAEKGAFSVLRASDGGFWLTGSADDPEEKRSGRDWKTLQIAVARLNPDGMVRWAKLFGAAGYDRGANLVETPDGGCLVVGVMGPANPVFSSLPGNADDESSHAQLDNEERLALWRQRAEESGTGVIRLSAAGDLEWAKRFDGEVGSLTMSDVLLQPDGNFLLTGTLGGMQHSRTPAQVKRSVMLTLSDQGEILHASGYGNDDNANCSVSMTGSVGGRALIAGFRVDRTPDNTRSGFQIIAFQSPELLGCRREEMVRVRPLELRVRDILPYLQVGDLPFTLEELDILTHQRHAVAEFRCSEEDMGPLHPGPDIGMDTLLQVSPNTVKSGNPVEVSFRGNIPVHSTVTVTRSATGTEVFRLANPEELRSGGDGSHIVDLPTQGYPAGVYLVRVEMGDDTLVQKLLVH